MGGQSERGHSSSGCPVFKPVKGGRDKQRQKTGQSEGGGGAGCFTGKL